LVFGLEYVALRYSNVYGPRQNPHGEAGVIAIFCNRILEGQKCDIFGDGNQKRDYVFVGDLARANVLSLRAPVGIYNLGTGIEISVNDLINILVKATGIAANVHYLPYRAGEVQRIALDISKAGKMIGWFPEVSFEDGLTRTWNWYTKRKMV
jgi:UDP-glucose 4-epimerase